MRDRAANWKAKKTTRHRCKPRRIPVSTSKRPEDEGDGNRRDWNAARVGSTGDVIVTFTDAHVDGSELFEQWIRAEVGVESPALIWNYFVGCLFIVVATIVAYPACHSYRKGKMD